MLTLSGTDRALFASDIHLGEHDPQTVAFFFDSLRRESASATHVFLLGDLFEAWIGDDQDDPVVDQTLAELRSVAQGRQLWLMHGNRDFLLDVAGSGAQAFSQRANAGLLEDPSRVDLFGTPVLLAHGDAWCIDDHAYQAFRRQARDPAWQQASIAQPIARRLAIARQIRQQSELEKRDKAAYLMDVNDAEVRRVMALYQVDTVIHGHTHRPARHESSIDGRPVLRWVLPDWEGASGRGGFLAVSKDGWQRIGW